MTLIQKQEYLRRYSFANNLRNAPMALHANSRSNCRQLWKHR
jgi:hypothetical protein